MSVSWGGVLCRHVFCSSTTTKLSYTNFAPDCYYISSGRCVGKGLTVSTPTSLRPDIVLIDISMLPHMNGIEATRIIRREVPESGVILISQ